MNDSAEPDVHERRRQSQSEHRVAIGLGANLGNRAGNITRALEALATLPRTGLRACSSFYLTRPVGGPGGQPAFINAAAVLETRLEPEVLLESLLEIERKLGRERREKWGPRPVDLDILLWDEEVISGERLQVPHPWLPARRFVLAPLAEIAPGWRHPAGWTIGEQRERLERRPVYLAITGALGVGKTTAAREFVRRAGAYFVEEVFNEDLLERVYSGDASAASSLQEWFARHRAEQLDRRRLCAPGGPEVIVSDFWFWQSLAYAMVEEDDRGVEKHRLLLSELQKRVLEPTLVILLEAPPAELLRRIHQRGRPFERPVTPEFVERLASAIRQLLRGPGAPAALTLPATDLPRTVEMLDAVLAGIRS